MTPTVPTTADSINAIQGTNLVEEDVFPAQIVFLGYNRRLMVSAMLWPIIVRTIIVDFEK